MSQSNSLPTILIIDDSRVNVALMKHIFKEYNIVAVHNGLEAMAVAKAEPRPDLILLDVMIPGIDGYEVCRRLKQDALTSEIPVVFITTQIEAENIIKGFDAGAIDYIPKPFKIPELQARVRTQITVKQSQDQNERLRKRIEEINMQLTASIVYAEKIQSASFPKREYLKKVMPEHFVMLKPRDIVSGDFYWVTKKSGKLVIAAVDCTGHGVPGAIMSVFGITFLRAIVEIGKQTTPSVILDEMRRLVIDALQQEADSEIKDGMDMSVVTIDANTSTFDYAGAFNPAYIVRNGELTILPADSMPVSIGEVDRSFTNHTFEYQKGDCLYLFSDGFASQFGGPKNKKVKQSGFKQLLVANAHLPMPQQHEVYDQFFTTWRGANDQIDDVLLMGVRL